MKDVRIIYDERPADALGRRGFTLLWTEREGVFRPEPSKEDGQPVGYRRGQCFFTDPEKVLERIRGRGETVEEL